MGIIAIYTENPGQINSPNVRRVRIITTDNLATVTTAGYLNPASLQGYTIYNTDEISMWYGATGTQFGVTNPGTFGIFTPSISNGLITLVSWANPGDVLLPVTANHIAAFNGATGQIYSPSTGSPQTIINNGGIQAGQSGTAGFFTSFPGTAANGSFIFKAINNTGNFSSTLSNSNTAQATVYSLPDTTSATANVLAAGAALVSGNLVAASGTAGAMVDAGFAAASVVQSQSTAANNHVSFTVVMNLGFAALATAGKVNIVAHPSASSQFVVTDIKVLNSTGLSGGSGNRLLSVTDGTVIWNNAGITAALLGTPIFTLWGGTGNPVANGSTQTSTAGADIYFQYTGGTTDYTAGSVTVAVTLVQVTA
jgi:hypothetical protein